MLIEVGLINSHMTTVCLWNPRQSVIEVKSSTRSPIPEQAPWTSTVHPKATMHLAARVLEALRLFCRWVTGKFSSHGANEDLLEESVFNKLIRSMLLHVIVDAYCFYFNTVLAIWMHTLTRF